MVRQGLTLKKDCEAKAVAIVQRLVLSDFVEREWFRDAVSPSIIPIAVSKSAGTILLVFILSL